MPDFTAPPEDIQLIGKEVAVRWPDGHEDYFDPEFLRTRSPSAENAGERDIFGNQYGGDGPREFPGVTVEGWAFSGRYGVVFHFSDGHNTGIYAWSYLRKLGSAPPAEG